MKTQTDNKIENYEWSNRSFNPSTARPHNWTTFYYCQGAGFNAGHKVYYGRNDWSDEQSAIDAQERWEAVRRGYTQQGERVFDSEDAEEWQRRSDEQGK